MAGIANDYLIYPILDLIRAELNKRTGSTVIDPFEGTPEVTLFRDYAGDPERVTGAKSSYESGYAIEISLTFGSDDTETYPLSATPEDPSWDYYVNGRLTAVTTVALNPSLEPLATYVIRLNYEGRGLLIGTTVERI
ncbi:hypothetical protein [Paenibacillus sp. NPDC058071]|uniref:hypothetical protein n=1 Tax=Paenibacillus sp. NPDC058071 TaxID=3346326 RepID=UPI0036DD1733